MIQSNHGLSQRPDLSTRLLDGLFHLWMGYFFVFFVEHLGYQNLHTQPLLIIFFGLVNSQSWLRHSEQQQNNILGENIQSACTLFIAHLNNTKLCRQYMYEIALLIHK